jgi:predicted outer membrane protein
MNSEAKEERAATPKRGSAVNEVEVEDDGDHDGMKGENGAGGPFIDAELRGLMEENEVLQSVRRALVQRITTAKRAYLESGRATEAHIAKKALLLKRLHYFTNGERYIDGAEIEVQPTDEHFLLFERFKASKYELLRAKASYEEKLHLVGPESSLIELEAATQALRSQANTLRKQVAELKQNHEQHSEKLRILIEDNKVKRMRKFLSFMHSLVLRFERNERTAQREENFNNIQLELLKLQHRQQLRNEERLLSDYS